MERSECTPYGDDTIQYEINAHQWNIGDEEDDTTYTEPAPLPPLVGEQEGAEIYDFFANEPRPQPLEQALPTVQPWQDEDEELSIEAIQALVDEEDARKTDDHERLSDLSEDAFRDLINEQDNRLGSVIVKTTPTTEPQVDRPLDGGTLSSTN